MGYCPKCGKQVNDGRSCRCSPKKNPSVPVQIDKDAVQGFWESMKNRMGIGEPERNATDTYEREMQIIPDNIKPNQNEIPVKQYNIAILRNLLRFERAEGRMQVTNKRVIFRAAGRSIGGRTTLQQEFNIDEIAGLEARRSYRFSFLHFIWGLITFNISALVAAVLVLLAVADSGARTPSPLIAIFPGILTVIFGGRLDLGGGAIIFGLLIGLGGMIPFFMMYKQFLIKLDFLGLSLGSFVVLASSGNLFFRFLLLLCFAISILGIMLYCLRDDFAIIIKNKGAMEQGAPIEIKRKRRFAAIGQDSGDGFAEVLPTSESEKAIREISAIINDIQKLGDLGVQKWVNREEK